MEVTRVPNANQTPSGTRTTVWEPLFIKHVQNKNEQKLKLLYSFVFKVNFFFFLVRIIFDGVLLASN